MVVIFSCKIDVLEVVRTDDTLNQVLSRFSATTPRAKEERRSSSLSAKAIESTTMGSGNIFSCPRILFPSWTATDLLNCQSQDYAPLLGLPRTIRTEALSNSAVCESDYFKKSLNVALDVFAKFRERQGDGVLDFDSEFAVANGGRLASLNWVPREQKHLTTKEIEIKLHAIDLNFKCRLGCPLRAVNDIPCQDEGAGTEDAGMIRRVGPGVRTLRPGDPVMTIKAGIFTAHAIILKKLYVQIPDNISFGDAAAMSTVFLTVAESMFNVAHLEKVQREAWVFAIQLAKAGTAMYATVRKGEKVKFLIDKFNIPRRRTYQHHDTRFVEGATRETNGRGVDVALNFLSSFSLSAGDGPDDICFVGEVESLGCAVEPFKVSVVNKEDVDRAIQLATNLKGILQTSMVLCDEAFSRLAYEDWNMATLPKVRYTWNLHETTRETGTKPDFFSSMRGTTGIVVQSNYASANTCLGSFAPYQTGFELRASHVDQRAVQDAGHVNDETLVKRMNLASTNDVSECELLEALGRKDGRITAYHNASTESDDGSGASSDFLEILLSQAQTKPSILKSRDVGGTLLIEISKRLFMFLRKSEHDPDVSTSLAALDLDSLVGVEMRSWWQKKREEGTQPYTKHNRRSDAPSMSVIYWSNGIISQRLGPGNTLDIFGRR
ncbi:KR domain-containing protein [Trichoderma sp. SZMC 28012]